VVTIKLIIMSENTDDELKLSLVPEIISMIFLLFYFFIITPLRYCRYQKELE
jgi:hypothetical protein